jgi:hypothetical protein
VTPSIARIKKFFHSKTHPGKALVAHVAAERQVARVAAPVLVQLFRTPKRLWTEVTLVEVDLAVVETLQGKKKDKTIKN